MSRKIEVEYDGEYSNTYSGTLVIKVDGEIIYDECFCCRSTGSVCFNDDWNGHVYGGELLWEPKDLNKFDKEIHDAVAEKLSEFQVCCGGCV